MRFRNQVLIAIFSAIVILFFVSLISNSQNNSQSQSNQVTSNAIANSQQQSFLNQTKENIKPEENITKEEPKQEQKAEEVTPEKESQDSEENLSEHGAEVEKQEVNESVKQPESVSPPVDFKIANWNLQIFGDTKASKTEVMSFYANTLKSYDIAFVQEIRNSDSSAFDSLCSMLPDYNCKASSRAGRSTSKEQYGVIYKKGIGIIEFKDFNPDSLNRWERPPVEVIFNISGYILTAYNIHTKPSDVSNELSNLEQIVSNQGNVVILGDLNADCSYYDHSKETQFSGWDWVLQDNEDTTLAASDCAYDRIIMNPEAYKEYVSKGIYTEGITTDISDHYLVWVELKAN